MNTLDMEIATGYSFPRLKANRRKRRKEAGISNRDILTGFTQFMKPYKLHIFVCHGKNCSAKGSEKLLEVLRDRLEAEGLASDIKTSKSGCLSVCKETDPKGGLCPAMVIYPEGVWYHKLAEDDMADIVEMHIKNGRLVERLLHHRM